MHSIAQSGCRLCHYPKRLGGQRKEYDVGMSVRGLGALLFYALAKSKGGA